MWYVFILAFSKNVDVFDCFYEYIPNLNIGTYVKNNKFILYFETREILRKIYFLYTSVKKMSIGF